LAKFKESLELRIRVKSFLCDKICENKQWLFDVFIRELDPYQEAEKNYKPGRGFVFKERYNKFVFKQPEIDQLQADL